MHVSGKDRDLRVTYGPCEVTPAPSLLGYMYSCVGPRFHLSF